MAALAAHPAPPKFRRPDASWGDDGLSRPAGRMVDAMLKDPAKANFAAGAGLPASWRSRFDQLLALPPDHRHHAIAMITRSEEHTSELQSLMCISYAVFY